MNKTLTIFGAIVLSLLIFSSASSVNAAFWSGKDLIAPDSSFGFLQTWKESIQTFFIFGVENKAKQYLHLADVRLDEYKKMIEQGKTDIAEKVLEKYQKQLNHALDKAEELKNEGKDIKGLSQKIEEATSKHLEVLQENLQKVPEQAKKGIENAIENSQKNLDKVLPQKNCIKEGKTGPSAGINPESAKNLPTECCEGLKPIEYSGLFEENCERRMITGAPSISCAKCGDGKCGDGETKCNCSQDCSKTDEIVGVKFKESTGKLSKGNGNNSWYLIVRKYNPQLDNWTEEAPVKLKFNNQSLCQATSIKQTNCSSFSLNQGADVSVEGTRTGNEVLVKSLIVIQ